MSVHKPLIFSDTEFVEIPVQIGDTKYVLREGSGEVVKKYQSFTIAKARYGSKGTISRLEDMGDSEIYLISLCLFLQGEGGKADLSKPVDMKTIEGFKSTVVATLFDKASEISGLKQLQTPKQIKEEIEKLEELLIEAEEGGAAKK